MTSNIEQFEKLPPNHDQDGQATQPSALRQTSETSKSTSQRRGRIHRVADFWLSWEIVGILGSAASIAGIIIMLHVYDNKAVPTWAFPLSYADWSASFHITLNAILAILSTVAATCVLIPLTKGLGQLKWVWFIEKDRALSDLEMFDAATRGVTGNLRLMWRMKFRHFAVLGAVASLLTLAYGPVIQEILQYDLEYQPGPDVALISYAREYNITNAADDVGDADRRLKFELAGSLYDVSNLWNVPPLHCSTGNCSWGDYATLGVCSRCFDLSDQLAIKCTSGAKPTCNVSLPNGFELGSELGNQHLMAINTTRPPLAFKNYLNPLANIQAIIVFDPSQHPSGTRDTKRVSPFVPNEKSIFRARECVLIPCVQVQQFAVITIQGALDVTNFGAKTELNVTNEYDDYLIDSRTGDVSITPPAEKLKTLANYDTAPDAYRIANASYVAMQTYLFSLLNGFAGVTQDGRGFDFHADEQKRLVYTGTQDVMHAIYKNSANGQWTGKLCRKSTEDVYQGDFECAARNMATGITVAMRDVSWNKADDPSKLVGVTLFATPWVHVVWFWIILPIGVWVMSTIVLVGTWYKTRGSKVGLWKTSPLAMLLLSLDRNDLANLKNWYELPEAELLREAKNFKIRLRVEEEGVRIEGVPRTA